MRELNLFLFDLQRLQPHEIDQKYKSVPVKKRKWGSIWAVIITIIVFFFIIIC